MHGSPVSHECFQGAVPKTLQIKKSTKINNGKRKLITIINDLSITICNKFKTNPLSCSYNRIKRELAWPRG